MITETRTAIIVLQLTDELLAQLQPYMSGLAIAVAAQRLMMRSEVYKAFAKRVGSALDYDVRWQPNEYEPDGFVERVRPLELTNGILRPAGFPHCGAQPPGQLRRDCMRVRPGGCAALICTPGRPDTPVSGRLFVYRT